MFLQSSSYSTNDFDCSLLETLAEVTLESISIESVASDKPFFEEISKNTDSTFNNDFDYLQLNKPPLNMPVPRSPVKFSFSKKYDTKLQTSAQILNLETSTGNHFPHQYPRTSQSTPHLRAILPKLPASSSNNTLLLCNPYTSPLTTDPLLSNPSVISPFVFQKPLNKEFPSKQKRKTSEPSFMSPSLYQNQTAIDEPVSSTSMVQSTIINTGLKKGRLDVIAYSSCMPFDPQNRNNQSLVLSTVTSPDLRKSVSKRRNVYLKHLFDRLRESLSLPGSHKYKKWDLLSKAIEKIENLKEKKKKIVHSIANFSRNLFKSTNSNSSKSTSTKYSSYSNLDNQFPFEH